MSSHVITVCFPFVGDSVGGSHKSALLLIKNINRDEYNPIIVVHKYGYLTKYLEEKGIRFQVLKLPVLAGSVPNIIHILFSILMVTPKIAYFLLKNKVNIVHGNDQRVNFSWPLATKLTFRKYVWHQRVLLSKSKLWNVIKYAANYIICISGAVKGNLPVNKNTMHSIIINPFELPVYVTNNNVRQEILNEFSVPDDTVIVGFVGRLVKQKRPELFLHAAKLIKDKTEKRCVFVLIGRGTVEDTSEIQNLIENLNLKDSVRLLGFCNPIEPYIKALDILLSPEIGDGFGRTIVESMLVKTPVIASFSGGHKEIIENEVTGLFAPEDNSTVLAEQAIRLINDEVFYDLIKNAAYLKAQNFYSVDKHVQKVCAIYKELNIKSNYNKFRSEA